MYTLLLTLLNPYNEFFVVPLMYDGNIQYYDTKETCELAIREELFDIMEYYAFFGVKVESVSCKIEK